jgi:2-phospho-L-lactate guanylyltransferase
MNTAAVLPVKRFAAAKQRLEPAVSHPLRGELARAMVADVLDALSACAAITGIIVVTSDESARALAIRARAAVVPDLLEDGQSSAAAIGVREAVAAGFARVLCVPGDCPALDSSELDELLAPWSEEQVVIVPDRHDTGTNALLLTPPNVIAPSFGPGSFARHRRLAEESRIPLRVQRPPSLLLDVDTGEDLDALRARIGLLAGAPRTRALLGEHLPVG